MSDVTNLRGTSEPGAPARRLSDGAIAAGYAVFAAGWIVVSDLVLGDSLDADSGEVLGNILKGLGFVLVTAVLLWLALRGRTLMLRRERAHSAVLEQELEAARRMDAVGRLAGGVAHDFNNLLTVMRGHLALARVDAAPTVQTHLDTIDQAAIRAGEMTKELLVVARRDVLHPEVIDLNELLHSFDVLLSGLLGDAVDVRMEPSPFPVPVSIDTGSFERVILNLATNARDAMPNGGSLTFRLRTGQLFAHLEVSDTGHGMDGHLRQHCFEPFFTTKPLGKGTGLGLSSAYGIVHQLGGRIAVRSTVGVGTTFEIELPLAS
jgi:signal transduction histidine kinase